MAGYLYAASFNPSGSGGGIHGFGWNARSGTMKPLGTVGQGVENPLCLLACPAGQYLHVGDCTADWRSGGALRSHRINPLNGTLQLIGSVDSAGQIPVSLTLAANGANLLVANCGPFDASTEGCTVAVLPVKNGGRLGPAKTVQQHTGIGTDPQRQTSPHPHCVALDLANRYAWVPDLGTDRIWCYAYDAHLGALLLQPDRSVAVTAGSGPRLLRFHPRGDSAYLINAIANTLVSYSYDGERLLETGSQSTLPAGVADADATDLVMSADGGCLYVSNRNARCISVFSIDAATCRTSLIEHVDARGSMPRGLALDPTGRFLVVGNDADNTIHAFKVADDGRLSARGLVAEMPGPTSLTFVQV